MQQIKPTLTKDGHEGHEWPRRATRTVECRKCDLVIRISDWTRDKSEPAYDVEVYIGGVYDWNESKTLSTRNAGRSKAEARHDAVEFAQKAIAKLL